MSQNSLVVPNGTGASVRSALNNALDTLKTQNSGSSAPGTTSAYMLWADTTNDLLKIRNAADSAWITIGRLSLTNLGLSPISRGDLWGMTLSNNGTDATNDIDVSAGSCASDDATDANRVLLNPGALTKQIDAVWAAGNAAGGRISSESLVDGTWHVYAFRRSGGSDDVCLSQSLTPSLPDSGTNKRRIGSLVRKAGAILGFVQHGDWFVWKTLQVDMNIAAMASTATDITLTVPTGIQVVARFNVVIQTGSGPSYIRVWQKDQTDLNATANTSSNTLIRATNSSWGGMYQLLTDTSGRVRYDCDLAGDDISVTTEGFVDQRGRLL